VLPAGIDGDLKSELKQVGHVNHVRQVRLERHARQVIPKIRIKAGWTCESSETGETFKTS
jgi:hypothetical protein